VGAGSSISESDLFFDFEMDAFGGLIVDEVSSWNATPGVLWMETWSKLILVTGTLSR
jgi:hypothetical protein